MLTNDDCNELFGLRMKFARVQKGLRQVDLAKQAGISVTSIAKIESGKHSILFHNAARISRLLGFSLDELSNEESALNADIKKQSPEIQAALRRMLHLADSKIEAKP